MIIPMLLTTRPSLSFVIYQLDLHSHDKPPCYFNLAVAICLLLNQLVSIGKLKHVVVSIHETSRGPCAPFFLFDLCAHRLILSPPQIRGGVMKEKPGLGLMIGIPLGISMWAVLIAFVWWLV